MTPLDLLRQDAERVAEAVDLSPLDGKAVLVTGATGLIGLNLLAALFHSPARWIMGASRNGLPPFCAEWSRDPRYVGLFLDQPDANPPKPDFIIHGAGYAQPSRFMAEAVETLRVNTQMTDRLLRVASENGARFMFLSSSEVYSGSSKIPHLEDDIGTTDPSHPRAPYIEGKRAGEAFVHAWRARGADAVIARPCLAYGPGVRANDARALSGFIREALTGKIRMQDEGWALRRYCYISDTVEMLLQVLLRGQEAVYNIGADGVARPIRTVARMVATMTESMLVIPSAVEATPGAPFDARVDIGRYLAEFPGKEFVPLDAGLLRTIAWHRAIMA